MAESEVKQPSGWRVGTKVFATLFEALVYQMRFTHHKIVPLYE